MELLQLRAELSKLFATPALKFLYTTEVYTNTPEDGVDIYIPRVASFLVVNITLETLGEPTQDCRVSLVRTPGYRVTLKGLDDRAGKYAPVDNTTEWEAATVDAAVACMLGLLVCEAAKTVGRQEAEQKPPPL